MLQRLKCWMMRKNHVKDVACAVSITTSVGENFWKDGEACEDDV